MAADLPVSLANWSTSAASNLPLGVTAITNLAENQRTMQSVVRYMAAADTIASAATCDLGTKESRFLTISGTTTITSLGSISAGISRWCVFSGALTLTHNASSLILPTGASITTAAGDIGLFLSLGSGNWRCMSFMRANGQSLVSVAAINDGTVAAPGMYFSSDTNTGIYRIGADNMGIACNGAKVLDIGTAGLAVTGTGSFTGALSSGAHTVTSGGIAVTGNSTITGTFGATATTNIFSLTAAAASLTVGSGNYTQTMTTGNVTYTMTAGTFTINLNKSNGLGTFSIIGTTGNGMVFTAGDDTGAGRAGGSISFTAGTGSGSADAGSINITGGNASTTANTKSINITGGNNSNGTAAAVKIYGGTSGTGSSSDHSGDIQLRPGVAGGNTYEGAARVQNSLGDDLLVVDGNRGCVAFGGSSVAGIASVSGHGAGSYVGNKNVMRITMGVGVTSTITITMTAPGASRTCWANTPAVMVNYETSNIAVRAAADNTARTITVTFASVPAVGGILHIHCLDYV